MDLHLHLNCQHSTLNLLSASATKLHTASPCSSNSSSKFIFADLAMLASLFQTFPCSSCSSSLELVSKPSSRRGFVHHLTVQCISCGRKEASSPTSKTVDGSKMYEMNRKMVFSFLNVGLRFAGMQNFSEVMGMEGMTEKTHRAHVAAIHRHGLDFKVDMLEDSAQRVRQAHGKKSGVLDLAVSFDGSWKNMATRLNTALVL